MIYNAGISGAAENLIKNEGSVEKAVLRAEKIVENTRNAIRVFSKNKKVTSDVNELRFIGVINKDFTRSYLIIKGMTIEVREKKEIDQEIFCIELRLAASFEKALIETLEKIFKHNFHQMAK